MFENDNTFDKYSLLKQEAYDNQSLTEKEEMKTYKIVFVNGIVKLIYADGYENYYQTYRFFNHNGKEVWENKTIFSAPLHNVLYVETIQEEK